MKKIFSSAAESFNGLFLKTSDRDFLKRTERLIVSENIKKLQLYAKAFCVILVVSALLYALFKGVHLKSTVPFAAAAAASLCLYFFAKRALKNDGALLMRSKALTGIFSAVLGA